MNEIKTVGLLGGGVIGGAWAARLAINGIDSVIFDPDPEAPRKVEEVMANARRAYRRLSLAPLHETGTVRYVDTVAECAEAADFIQENAPERLELKQGLLGEASRSARPEVIIASSTSGYRPSELAAECEHPERVCVGHPFNPAYLLPLVEIVGSDKTTDAVRQRAADFYTAIGMHPLQVRHEVDGHIADRLQEAIWREALHMIDEGVATTDEIDQSIIYGPGLRWAFMGTCLTFRLAGGEEGMNHFLHQFAPALKLDWTKLQAPDMTDALIARITEQSDAQAEAHGNRGSIRELERLRDDCLISVMQALRSQDYAAGKTLRGYEERLYEASHKQVMPEGEGSDDGLTKPLRLHEARVEPEWVDYNGHLTESRYLQVFGDSSDALFRYLGIDAAYHDAGFSYYTVETHICHLREVAAEEPLYVTTQILDADDKRMHVFHTMHNGRPNGGDDTPLATAEQMLLHVDTKAGKACPAQPEVLARVKKLAEAQAGLPKPDRAGRRIGIGE